VSDAWSLLLSLPGSIFIDVGAPETLSFPHVQDRRVVLASASRSVLWSLLLSSLSPGKSQYLRFTVRFFRMKSSLSSSFLTPR